MSANDSSGSGTRDSHRVPIESSVDLEFQSFQGFLTEYSSNISLGGMFVRSEEPPPPGTMLNFSLRLKDEMDLVTGLGQVMWVRNEAAGDDLPTGMGIRFLDLEGESAALIQRMVEQHQAQGGETFDVASPAGEVATLRNVSEEAPSPPVATPEPAEGFGEDDGVTAKGEAIPWPPPPDALAPEIETPEPVAPDFGSAEVPASGAPETPPQPGQEASSAAAGEKAGELPGPWVPEPWQPPSTDSEPSPGTRSTASDGEGSGEDPEAAQWPPKVPRVQDGPGGGTGTSAEAWSGTSTGTWSGTGTGTGSGGALQEEIFVPPPLGSDSSNAETSEAPPPTAGASGSTEEAARRGGRSPWVPSLPVIALMVVSLIVGALGSRYLDQIVGLFDGFDSEAAERVLHDVPPPATLESLATGAEESAVEMPSAAAEDRSQDSEMPRAAPTQQAASPAEGPRTEGPAQDGATEDGATEDVAPLELGPPDPGAQRLNQVRLITWKAQGAGTTVVTLWGNGQLRQEDLDHIRIDGRPARELLKLRGINWPFRNPILDANTGEVRRIRTGFHPKATGNELHIVLDLEDPQIHLARVERDANKILLYLSR
ncbi:MAG: TIGR02266 family protein [Acidobacteriota bacterium]|nr:TIGR02266 family protein [Acidobacteriota bacterium]